MAYESLGKAFGPREEQVPANWTGHWVCSRNVKKAHVVKTQWMTESRKGLDQETLCRSNVKDVENTRGALEEF